MERSKSLVEYDSKSKSKISTLIGSDFKSKSKITIVI